MDLEELAAKVTLPAWASFAAHQEPAQVPRVDVDGPAMYRAWLAEFAASPANPADFPGGHFTVRNAARPGVAEPLTVAPMTAAEAVCDPEKPTQYWLEVAFQCMKLDLQVAMRSFAFEIRVHDSEKSSFALAKAPPGRGLVVATWGKEAKAHFRRLRGFLPG